MLYPTELRAQRRDSNEQSTTVLTVVTDRWDENWAEAAASGRGGRLSPMPVDYVGFAHAFVIAITAAWSGTV
jgi:hypothetical protein